MKAIILVGPQQFTVEKCDKIEIPRTDKKTLEFEPLMLTDGDKIQVGKPTVKGAVVKAKVLEDGRSKKVMSIRYKAKKRVHKLRGHRQEYTLVEITDISDK